MGAGDDTLSGGSGNDTLNGNGGIDTADYRDAVSGLTIDLSAGAPINDTLGGQDTLQSIENLIGGDHADTLTGDGISNVLWGR